MPQAAKMILKDLAKTETHPGEEDGHAWEEGEKRREGG